MTNITPEELEELKRLTAIATQEHHTEESIYEFVLEPLGCAFACAVLNAAPALIRSAEELGRVMARREPTEAMLNAARDWSGAKYGKPIGNDAAIGCWQAMFDAAYDRTAK